MGTILDELSLQNRNTTLMRESLRRVYDVRAPCQWLNHCDGGKCPCFVKINGNYYCSKRKV